MTSETYTILRLMPDDHHVEVLTGEDYRKIQDLSLDMYMTDKNPDVLGYAVTRSSGQWVLYSLKEGERDELIYLHKVDSDKIWNPRDLNWEGRTPQTDRACVLPAIRARYELAKGLIPSGEGYWHCPSGKDPHLLLRQRPEKRERTETEQINKRVAAGTNTRMMRWAEKMNITAADVIEQGFELMQEKYGA